ncbi:hypothetical protein ACETAC_01400 [Aceticella autotrophica]|uniref:Uncharacterized protein n=1 Tax=Aceticella autotrophica TaxID=2755338 RepID=A0A975AW86_9THEO|nr:NBR1-Ig-like domain-containing protein [Aceticella autotrophica]QSZ27599.1 hypothetical protein ACETAC_01400 [Aceticella autotrophica]
MSFFKNEKGASNIISLVVLLPVLLTLIYGISMFGHLSNVKSVTEEASRAGARWLASHPGDITGAKIKAAEVIGESFTVTQNINNINTTNKFIGYLTYPNNKFYIDNVYSKPANSSIKQSMQSLINQYIMADGHYITPDVFQVNTATTDPPEIQTYTETASLQNNQTQPVNQTGHSEKYPAAVIGQYGCAPWGTWWLPSRYTVVSTNYSLYVQLSGKESNKSSNLWVPPGKVSKFHVKYNMAWGNSDNGQVNAKVPYNGQYATCYVIFSDNPCSSNYSLSGDTWVDMPSNIPQDNMGLFTGLFSSGPASVSCQTPSWIDVPEVMIDSNPQGWSDTSAYWIWGGNQNYTVSAVNGQEVTLTRYFWADNTNYTVSAAADDHFSAYIDATNILNGDGPAVQRWHWTTGGAGWHTVTIHARNDYGPAGVLFSIQRDDNSSILLHTDSSWSYQPVDGIKYGSVTLPKNAAPNSDFTVNVPVTNLTKATWNSNSTYISYHWYDSNGNPVVTNGNIARFHNNLAGGASDTVSLVVHTPSTPGKYRLQIDGCQQNAAWFGPINGVNWPTVDAWINVGSSYSVDYSPVDIPKYMEKGKTYNISVTAKNTGTTTWIPNVTGLSYHLYNASGNQCIQWDGTRNYVAQPVAPGQSYTFTLPFTAPNTAGTYQIQLDMVQEGVTWFSWQGSPTVWGTIQVPDGDVLKGQLTYDGSDYYVNNYILQTQIDLSGYAGKNVILWGKNNGQQKIYVVTDIQPYNPNNNAVKTFDPILDVYCNDPNASDPNHPYDSTVNYKRTDGYAYCRVTYHFPTPLTNFWKYAFNRHMWYRAEPLFINESGESFFRSNEE